MTYYKLTTIHYFDNPRRLGEVLTQMPYDMEIVVEKRKLRRYL